jgi:hypothetical protein
MSPDEVTTAMHQTADSLAPLIKKLNIKLD